MDDSASKALLEMVAALQKEMVGLREQMQDQPTVGQVDKLQQQLRDQKSEMSAMRSNVDMIQRQMGEMASRLSESGTSNSSPQMQVQSLNP